MALILGASLFPKPLLALENLGKFLASKRSFSFDRSHMYLCDPEERRLLHRSRDRASRLDRRLSVTSRILLQHRVQALSVCEA
jgi:hypothetical protein